MFDFFFERLGVLVVLLLLWKYFSVSVFKLLLSPFKERMSKRYGQNSWAVVTGASDGLGKGFCEELAKEGFNIVLMARNKQKLEKVARELEQLNPAIQTQTIIIDFKDSYNEEIFRAPLNQLAKLDVSILVNNVGMDALGYYHEIPEQFEFELTIVNIFPLARLTKALIPEFLKRKNHSAIINVGSTSGARPMPYFSVYSATKAFNNFFSQALSIEYPKIDILSLQPMYISTPLTHHKTLGFDTISSNECARATLDDLGYTRRTYGHWKHKILASLIEFVPDFLFDRLAFKLGIKKEMERRENAKKSH